MNLTSLSGIVEYLVYKSGSRSSLYPTIKEWDNKSLQY